MNSPRDKIFRELRPIIDALPAPKGSPEHFQNTVLRPLIKFQSDLIFQLAREHFHRLEPKFPLLKQIRQKELIRSGIKSNLPFQQIMINIIVALFTQEETDYYLANRKECNKRILQIMEERLNSQPEKLL